MTLKSDTKELYENDCESKLFGPVIM